MIYTKFNKYIFDIYFNSDNSGDEIIMSVDESVINQFQKGHKVTKAELQESFKYHFHRNWEYALELNSEIPNFFGLIAIQIYIASQMKDENEELTHRTYNPRLIDYLGIKKEHLNKIYPNYQDNIWQGLKTWSNKNNYQITIPEIGYGPGCYIAYPLSHSLLNKEDLKYIPLLFDCCGYRPHEDISFLDFKDEINKHIDNQKITSHFSRTKNRLEDKGNLDRLYNQIYSFYNNEWEGEVPIINENASTKTNVETFKNIERTDFYYNYEKGEIYKLTGNDNRSETIYLTDLKLFDKIKKDSNTLFFEKGNYEEWQYTRTLSFQTYIIICENHNRYILNQLGNVLNDFSYRSNNRYTIKEVEVTNFNQRFFSKDIHAYSLENGLKIGRAQWLRNAGPDIVVNINNEIRINGVPNKGQRISLRNFEVGTYKIRGGTKRTDIEIVELPIVSINSKETGWCIEKKAKKWQYAENEYNINGLNFIFSIIAIDENTQTWINAVLKKQKKQKYKTQIINALNRRNYGI